MKVDDDLVAVRDFRGTEPGELSIRAGALVRVVTPGRVWMTVEHLESGDVGSVPTGNFDPAPTVVPDSGVWVLFEAKLRSWDRPGRPQWPILTTNVRGIRLGDRCFHLIDVGYVSTFLGELFPSIRTAATHFGFETPPLLPPMLPSSDAGPLCLTLIEMLQASDTYGLSAELVRISALSPALDCVLLNKTARAEVHLSRLVPELLFVIARLTVRPSDRTATTQHHLWIIGNILSMIQTACDHDPVEHLALPIGLDLLWASLAPTHGRVEWAVFLAAARVVVPDAPERNLRYVFDYHCSGFVTARTVAEMAGWRGGEFSELTPSEQVDAMFARADWFLSDKYSGFIAADDPLFVVVDTKKSFPEPPFVSAEDCLPRWLAELELAARAAAGDEERERELKAQFDVMARQHFPGVDDDEDLGEAVARLHLTAVPPDVASASTMAEAVQLELFALTKRISVTVVLALTRDGSLVVHSRKWCLSRSIQLGAGLTCRLLDDGFCVALAGGEELTFFAGERTHAWHAAIETALERAIAAGAVAAIAVPPEVSTGATRKCFHRKPVQCCLPLHSAVMTGDVWRVRHALDAYGTASIDFVDEQGLTPLWRAAVCGFDDIVVELLSRGADVDGLCGGKRRWTPLLGATARGHLSIVGRLLQAGAAVDGKRVVIATPIGVAVDANDTALVELLLAAGATPRLGLLGFAFGNGSDDALLALIRADARSIRHFLTPAVAGGQMRIAEAMIAGGVDPNSFSVDGTPPIVAAATQADVVARLLELGAHVDALDARRRTALSVAAAEGACDSMSLLLAAGADARGALSAWGGAPLIGAMRNGHVGAALMLIASGANVDEAAAAPEACATPLAIKCALIAAGARQAPLIADAVKHGDFCEIAALVTAGASAQSVLRLACDGENIALARQLLTLPGVDLNDVLRLCIDNGRGSSVAFLLNEAGASVAALGVRPDLLLFRAVEKNHTLVLRRLVRAGLSLDVPDMHFLSVAVASKHFSTVDTVLELLMCGADVNRPHPADPNLLTCALREGCDPLILVALVAAGIDDVMLTVTKMVAELVQVPAALYDRGQFDRDMHRLENRLKGHGTSVMSTVALRVCGALQELELPTLLLLAILDELCPFAYLCSMYAKWNVITVVRHFHDRKRKAVEKSGR